MKNLIATLLGTILCLTGVRAEQHNSVLPEVGPKRMLTQNELAAIAEDANNTNKAIAEFIRVNAGAGKKVRFLRETASMDGDTFARVKFLFETTLRAGGTNTFAIDKVFFAPSVQLEAGKSVGTLYASEGHDVGVNWHVDKKPYTLPVINKAALQTLMAPAMTSGFRFERLGRSVDGMSAVFTHPEKNDALVIPFTYFRVLPQKGQPLEFVVETLSNAPLVSWRYKGLPTRNDDFDEMRITAENAVATIEGGLENNP